MHCAEDLIPAGVKWPGAAEAFAHAHAAEATLRAEILRLRFGGSEPPNDLRHQNLPTAEVANKMGVSEARVAKAIRMASRQVPLVADRPAPAWVQRAILFEADDLLVINKPPGINHHPKHRWAGGSLLNAVMGYVADQREANDGESLNEESVFPVHRLDAETSGVTVFAKSRASASVLGQMMCRDVRIGSAASGISETTNDAASDAASDATSNLPPRTGQGHQPPAPREYPRKEYLALVHLPGPGLHSTPTAHPAGSAPDQGRGTGAQQEEAQQEEARAGAAGAGAVAAGRASVPVCAPVWQRSQWWCVAEPIPVRRRKDDQLLHLPARTNASVVSSSFFGVRARAHTSPAMGGGGGGGSGVEDISDAVVLATTGGHGSYGYGLVRCRLLTGRTHQIRIHMEHAGMPVVGDKTYDGSGGSCESGASMMRCAVGSGGSGGSGGDAGSTSTGAGSTGNGAEAAAAVATAAAVGRAPPAGGLGGDGARLIGRQALHAWRLQILHPRSLEPMEFTAPLPEDIAEACRRCSVTVPQRFARTQ
jgi:23S rRNA-/tRNA-specific pseudouridylate synthase